MPLLVRFGLFSFFCFTAYLDTTVLFSFPIQIVLSLPFQKGQNGILTAETIALWKGPIFDKCALNVRAQAVIFVVVLPQSKREGI